NSWFIGDKKLDIETGFNAGLRTALVKTGYGASHAAILDRSPNI
ncbi:MAG TPA: D,D-heptose 1,7-bisphosphate phosphatase, partial [Blastocatellia bacterium]|nr:D,D-heptose 1,7-bisphosphate phosphatase [Blastocatellia bacterium]